MSINFTTQIDLEDLTDKFCKHMNSAGYEATDEFRDALMVELVNCQEADDEDESNDSKATLFDALTYAAGRIAQDFN